MKNKIGYIYLIINLWNNKKYVGQSKRISQNHQINYFGSGDIIIKKIKKYGKKNFKKIILGFCYSDKELDLAEKTTIAFFNTSNRLYGYNIKKTAVHNSFGEKNSIEHKNKISKSLKQFYNSDKGVELKNNKSKLSSGKNNPMFGISPKERIFNKHKINGDIQYNIFLQKLKNKRSPLSKDHKEKLSEIRKNEWLNDDMRKKRFNSLLNSTNPWKPRLDINYDDILKLAKQKYNLSQICCKLHCSSSVIINRIKSEGHENFTKLKKTVT